MRSIADTPAHERYLMVAERISPGAWEEVCQQVRNYLASATVREKKKISGAEIAEMFRLIDTPLPPTSHPFVVLFAYADIPKGTEWNVVFDPLNPSQAEATNAVFHFSVILQRIACPAMDHNFHQLAVIDFPNGVPDLLASLPLTRIVRITNSSAYVTPRMLRPLLGGLRSAERNNYPSRTSVENLLCPVGAGQRWRVVSKPNCRAAPPPGLSRWSDVRQ